MQIKIISFVSIITLCCCIGFYIGGVFTEKNFNPDVIIETEHEVNTVYIPYEVIQPVVRFVRVEVEKIVYETRPIHPRQFESVEHFKEWYHSKLWALLEGDCDDYAENLQDMALREGYSISQALTLNGYYFGVLVMKEKKPHAGNVVLINDIYYWVEPDPDKFKVIHLVPRD